MVATGSEITHQQDFRAEHQIEVMIGTDKIVRVNIDGVCAIRAKAEGNCKIEIHNDLDLDT